MLLYIDENGLSQRTDRFHEKQFDILFGEYRKTKVIKPLFAEKNRNFRFLRCKNLKLKSGYLRPAQMAWISVYREGGDGTYADTVRAVETGAYSSAELHRSLDRVYVRAERTCVTSSPLSSKRWLIV